ncbi:MAG: hypothetical protein AB2A00_14935 [Myxococcota bacterium]
MEKLKSFTTAVERYTNMLRAPEYEPDPARVSSRAKEMGLLLEAFQRDVVQAMPDALRELHEKDHPRIKVTVVELALQVAALLVATGAQTQAAALLSAVRDLTADEDHRELVESALHLEVLRMFMHARWLRRRKDKRAQPVLQALSARTLTPGYRRMVQVLLDAPEPIDGPPSLTTFNGIGTVLAGSRDERPDGSYVSTLFFCVLFIPLVPISAYRVVRAEGGGWYFLGKVPLSPAMIWMRRVVAALFVVGGTGLAVNAYFNSSEYQLRQALAEAQQVEKDQGAEAGVAAYTRLLRQYRDSVGPTFLREPLDHWTRVRLAGFRTPFDVVDVAAATALMSELVQYPAGARDAAGARAAEKFQAWAEELARRTPAPVDAVLRLHEEVLRVALGPTQKKSEEAIRVMRRAQARELEQEWPVRALHAYLELGSDEDITAAANVLEKLQDRPMLLHQERAVVERWLERMAKRDAAAVPTEEVKRALATATETVADKEREAALESGNQAALRRLLQQRPHDQEVLVVLAILTAQAGDQSTALKMIQDHAPVGMLIHDGQRFLASLLQSRGDLAAADTILTNYLALRLPAFLRARDGHAARERTLRNQHVDDANRGRLPSDIQQELNHATRDDAQRLFEEWLQTRLAEDAVLNRLAEEYRAHSDVVPVSVTLGTLKLRRAQTVSGTERDALLKAAENTFLAIGGEAEGTPEFHLGYGQVLHRLGRGAEGDAELQKVLSGSDRAQHLDVARAYRVLGLHGRAQEVAREVFERGNTDEKHSAAILLSLLATTQEQREEWLLKADSSVRFVRHSLMEVQGMKLMRAGKFAEADTRFAEITRDLSRTANQNATDANNAAVVFGLRHRCTGDPKHIQQAVQMLGLASRQDPDDTVVIANLASALTHQARLRALDRHLKTQPLAVDDDDADTILDQLAGGPLRETLVTNLTSDASHRRALDLLAQEEVLAPGRGDAYENQLTWLELAGNVQGLNALLERVRGLKALDTSAEDEARARYLAGTDDANRVESLTSEAARYRVVAEEQQKAGQAPVAATAWWLVGRASRSVFELTRDVKHAHAARDAFERAGAGWPALGPESDVAFATLDVAAGELAREHKDFADVYFPLAREYGWANVLRVLEKEHPAQYARLKARPEVAQAARLLHVRAARGNPTLGIYALARLADDTALQEKARALFQDEKTRLSAEISALLHPNSRNVQLTLAALKAGP